MQASICIVCDDRDAVQSAVEEARQATAFASVLVVTNSLPVADACQPLCASYVDKRDGGIFERAAMAAEVLPEFFNAPVTVVVSADGCERKSIDRLAAEIAKGGSNVSTLLRTPRAAASVFAVARPATVTIDRFYSEAPQISHGRICEHVAAWAVKRLMLKIIAFQAVGEGHEGNRILDAGFTISRVYMENERCQA